jgi:hypothetical protein
VLEDDTSFGEVILGDVAMSLGEFIRGDVAMELRFSRDKISGVITVVLF